MRKIFRSYDIKVESYTSTTVSTNVYPGVAPSTKIDSLITGGESYLTGGDTYKDYFKSYAEPEKVGEYNYKMVADVSGSSAR